MCSTQAREGEGTVTCQQFCMGKHKTSFAECISKFSYHNKPGSIDGTVSLTQNFCKWIRKLRIFPQHPPKFSWDVIRPLPAPAAALCPVTSIQALLTHTPNVDPHISRRKSTEARSILAFRYPCHYDIYVGFLMMYTCHHVAKIQVSVPSRVLRPTWILSRPNMDLRTCLKCWFCGVRLMGSSACLWLWSMADISVRFSTDVRPGTSVMGCCDCAHSSFFPRSQQYSLAPGPWPRLVDIWATMPRVLLIH